jgi:hypothetical protein
MSLSQWIRQIHRWLSIAFTLGVIVNTIAVATGRPPYWLYFFALIPLFLLLFSGLYLFALPYFTKARAGQRVGAEG